MLKQTRMALKYLSWLPGNFSIPPTSLSALRRAGLSDLIISAIFTKSGEWINMGSQRSTSYDESGNLSSFSWLYCYQGGWNVGKCFTQFSRTQYGYTYFCINYPPRAYQRLRAYVSYRPNVVYRTLFVDTLAAGECLRGFQEVVDDKRIDLFFHEKQYTDEQIDFDNAPRELHRLSKHWHTLMQDCGNFDILLDFMHAVIPKYRSKLHKAGWKLDKSSKPKETWNVLRLQSGSITRWTMVYRDRTNLRINLLFHLTNQREARTNTQIAASTAKVAEQTQRDSASMITIAAVTMFFLPGTFVSAILSTTFFDHGPDGLQVSKKWWILLAATLPLTIVVFAVWFGWRYLKIERKQTSDIAEKKLI
ncbi:hypothetical protein BDV96DRAFT_85666 [Lophiotrema nucula]|uniref:Cora-like Mg2+ transporter protein-domain-containing protein n=1 Tax=Lophiotrema nucula TaxID=690887 RepID=A0A6A5Z711_9PLEO|nr:hypothetical protein BDV96DRAFT_85666 [Lophiotrema nucula]